MYLSQQRKRCKFGFETSPTMLRLFRCDADVDFCRLDKAEAVIEFCKAGDPRGPPADGCYIYNPSISPHVPLGYFETLDTNSTFATLVTVAETLKQCDYGQSVLYQDNDDELFDRYSSMRSAEEEWSGTRKMSLTDGAEPSPEIFPASISFHYLTDGRHSGVRDPPYELTWNLGTRVRDVQFVRIKELGFFTKLRHLVVNSFHSSVFGRPAVWGPQSMTK
jgi:hypothetical protein